MKYLLILSMFFLSSCAKFRDGSSVWGDWLWAIPSVTGAAALFCWIACIVGSKSGSTQQKQGYVDPNTGKVPFTKVAYFPWAVGLTIITILIIIGVNASK